MTSAAEHLTAQIETGQAEPEWPDGLDDLRLDGVGLRVALGGGSGAVQACDFEETMSGASTVTLTLYDPDDEVTTSAILDREVVIDVLGHDYVLVKVTSRPPMLTLVFEDRAVTALRRHDKPLKADRKKVTRAEFIYRMVREVKHPRIGFFAPELHKKQPIGKQEPTAAEAKRKAKKQVRPGFHRGAHITVKGKAARRAQLRVIDDILETGASMGADKVVLVMSIMVTINESKAQNLAGGDRDSTGAFQQRRSQGWPASRNVKTDAREFFKRAIRAYKRYKGTGHSLGWIADTVQRGYQYGTADQGKGFDRWHEEAVIAVNVWLGDASLASLDDGTTTRPARYVFTRGEAGRREDSWEAAGRLADEVRWRRFARRGVIWLVTDKWLIARPPRMVLNRRSKGVQQIDYDYDRGKRAQTATLTIFASELMALPGDRIDLEKVGRAGNGPYLLDTARRSLLAGVPVVTCDLRRATKPLPEPPPELVTVGGGSLGDFALEVRGGRQSANLEAAYARAHAIHKAHYPYSWAGGHPRAGSPTGGPVRGYDCSGACGAVLAAGRMGFRPGQPVPDSGTMARSWGKPGRGEHLTLWANGVHAFLEFHGMRRGKGTEHFGTGNWGKGWSGAGFNPRLHTHAGFTARHWPGT